MSCMISACFKQRLAQVGTCLAIGASCRTTVQVLPVSQRCSKNVCHITSHVRQFRAVSEPLLSTALVRRGRVVENPEEEYRKLVDEASGLEEKMKEISDTGRPVITVPLHLEKRLERKMQKESTKRAIRQKIVDASRTGNKSKIIIHCKRDEFNHYQGQSYRTDAEVPLASGKWKHRKAAGDFFTLFPGFKREAQFYMEGADPITFNDLGVSQTLCDNLTKLGIEKPTHIQVFGVPQLLKGGYNIVAAETGCGKTLAYLLPIIQHTMEDKRYRARQKPGHPSTVILVPSRELADQIYGVAKRLTQNTDVQVKVIQGGSLGSKIMSPPQTSCVDILIATTNALKVLCAAGAYGTGKILNVVLDEADTLLDDSFFPELVGPFLNRLQWDDIQRDMSLTLVSATMPKGIQHTVGQIVKVQNFSNCTTPGLHHTLPHVPQTFLRLRKSQKPDKIKELIRKDVENKIPVLIFCNKSETCDWLSYVLNDEGIDAVSVHGRMPLKYRIGRLEYYQRGEINVLISTDLASRGIDTVRTQHVINYEFPLHIADYIHRCGRTGRVGSLKGCHVTNLVSRHGEINTVQQIERSVRKEMALPDVNANIKRLYGQRYGSFVEIQPIRDEDEEHETDNDHEESNDEYEEDTSSSIRNDSSGESRSSRDSNA